MDLEQLGEQWQAEEVEEEVARERGWPEETNPEDAAKEVKTPQNTNKPKWKGIGESVPFPGHERTLDERKEEFQQIGKQIQ